MSDPPEREPAEQRPAISALNDAFAGIATWSYDHRWVVLGLCAALLAGSLWLASRARIDNSFEAYFATEDPAYAAYQRYREDFGSDEIAYLLYQAPGRPHGPWDLEVMRKIAKLTAALEDEVPFVYEATSLANAEIVTGVPDGIEIRKLVDEFPETQEEMLAARDVIMGKPLYVDGLVSRDGSHGAIIVEMDRSSTDPVEEIRLDPEGGDGLDNLYPQVTQQAIDEILARPEYADLRFWVSGDVPLNNAYNVIIAEEGPGLERITMAVIAALLFVFFRAPAPRAKSRGAAALRPLVVLARSWISVVGPLVVVWLSVLLAVALVVALGWQLDMMFGSVPTLLTAVGVAHSVHILSEFRARLADSGDRREAARETLRLVGTPCLLTSLTTAVGFLAMNVSPIVAISHMAVYSAAGVFAAFALSVTLLMFFLSLGRRDAGAAATPEERLRAKGGRHLNAALEGVARFVIRRRVALLVAFGGVFALSLAGIARLQVDSNWLDDFSDRVPLKGDTQYIDEVMGGMGNLVYLFDAGEPGGVKDPALLREMDALQQRSGEHEIVKKTYSLGDVLKDLNQAFHEGDPARHTLPDSRELVAQYLLLYESSGGEEVEEYVSSDFSRANLELRMKITRSTEIAGVVDTLDEHLRENPLVASRTQITGIGALWLELLDYITVSQIQGFLLAFGAIAAMMCFIFGSLKTGLISMVPNLSPVFLTLGVMGWFDVPLDYNKLFIATVAIGIAVDDTIHLMTRYHHEFLASRDYRLALVEAVRDVGRALFITSVALIAGFLVFLASVMDATATFGVLLASTIFTALIADFLLMPALVMTVKPWGPEGGRQAVPEPVERRAA